KLIYAHFFLATIGVLLYITSMWVSGIGQGLMLRAFDEFGNLKYTFVETVVFMHYPLAARAIGGMFFVAGMLIMAYNVYKTIALARENVADKQAVAATA
ncbi:MAG TPA: cytochrome C oxidase Cbb3, partial [Thiothrix sp.]|nr:cytochrome C oxidase Cbb3 [Thiothrix sp.]